MASPGLFEEAAREAGGVVVGIPFTTTTRDDHRRVMQAAYEQMGDGQVLRVPHQCGDLIKGGQYVIKGVLGREAGGRGIMYEAGMIGGGPGMRLTVKALSLRTGSSVEELACFATEARLMMSLDHRGIPQYVDCFEEDLNGDWSVYLVQGVVCGKSLEALITEKEYLFSEANVTEIAMEVLHVLSYLESRRPPVIHGRVNPGNIVVDVQSARTETSWAGHVKLINFGAGVQDKAMASIALDGGNAEVVLYMAPEQLLNHNVVAQSDLYAVGATILFMLSGGRTTSTFPRQLLKVQFRDQVYMSRHLADLLDRLLEPAPENRFASAEDVMRALHGSRQPAVDAVVRASSSVPPTTTRVVSRQPAWSSVSLSVVGQQLKVDIPPQGLTSVTAVFMIFGVAFCVAAVLVAYLIFTDAPGTPWYVIFVLPCILAGASTGACGLHMATEQTSLRIHAGGRFSIKRSHLGYCLGSVEGDVQDISEARMAVTRDEDSDPIAFACELIEGTRTHRIGSHLKEADVEWLVGRINEFLISSRAV